MATTNTQILVVEDEHVVALDIETCVSELGFEPHVAHSASEAIDTVKAYPIELILMDIKLKGDRDGIDAAQAIHRVRDVPIVYLTAYTDNETIERARATEPYGYLLKPFQERELKATVEMSLHRSRLERQRSAEQLIHRFFEDSLNTTAATLDHVAIARAATELLVPSYADWCALQLFGAQRVTLTMPNGRETVTRSGLLASIGQTAQSQLLLDGSALGVPLLAGSQLIGAFALAGDPNRPRYRLEDILLFEGFGRRLGAALVFSLP